MSSPENGGKILFTVNSADAEKAARALKKGLGCEAEVSYDFAKISIIGAGLEANSGIAAKVFDALKNAGIDIRLITTSEIKISVLVRKDDSIVAVRELHNKLIEKSRL